MGWRALFQESILHKAKEYIRSGSVWNLQTEENHISADVGGIVTFHVQIDISGDKIDEMRCGCPHSKGGDFCEHMAAVLLAWENNRPQEPVQVSEAGTERTEMRKTGVP